MFISTWTRQKKSHHLRTDPKIFPERYLGHMRSNDIKLKRPYYELTISVSCEECNSEHCSPAKYCKIGWLGPAVLSLYVITWLVCLHLILDRPNMCKKSEFCEGLFEQELDYSLGVNRPCRVIYFFFFSLKLICRKIY